MSVGHISKLVVIFIKDYLEKTSPCITTDISSEEAKSSIVEFPSQTVHPEGCSKEEIGKLVDKLMSMPESSGFANDIHSDLYKVDEDPLLAVANRLLEEDLS